MFRRQGHAGRSRFSLCPQRGMVPPQNIHPRVGHRQQWHQRPCKQRGNQLLRRRLGCCPNHDPRHQRCHDLRCKRLHRCGSRLQFSKISSRRSGFDVGNHSYVGGWGNTANDLTYYADRMRRFDYVINRDNTVMAVATSTAGLMAASYNAISVGESDGGHGQGLNTKHGEGRYKPDLVAPRWINQWLHAHCGQRRGIAARGCGRNQRHSKRSH